MDDSRHGSRRYAGVLEVDAELIALPAFLDGGGDALGLAGTDPGDFLESTWSAFDDLEDRLAAEVIDDSFKGMNRVQQQRAVYAALKGKMDGSHGELHALALTTKAPD